MKSIQKSILVITLILVSFNLSAQKSFDEIYNQKLNFDQLTESEAMKFYGNISFFLEKDMDSLDLYILLTPQILEYFIVNMVSENEPTYGVLYEKFIEYKENDSYNVMRIIFETQRILEKRSADYNNWEEDKKLFIDLGTPEEDLENIRQYIEKNSNPKRNYKEVMKEYTYYIEDQEIKPKSDFEKVLNYRDNIINIDSLLVQSKEENKPIMLYFTGQNVVNAKRLELYVLGENQIHSKLTNQFIFVPLYVDNRNKLPETECFETDYIDLITTIGGKNAHFQKTNYNVRTQPYLVVLNSNNVILGKSHYKEIGSVQLFNEFMNKVLLEFEK